MVCEYVCVYVVCGCVRYHDKTKTADRNDLKLGTVLVLDTLSRPVDLIWVQNVDGPLA